ncbi:MAG TPA: hypothetical protein PL099_02720 [Thermoclostridium caenicola]|nr:hypothetical protein [Thermoclostridium caenicola]
MLLGYFPKGVALLHPDHFWSLRFIGNGTCADNHAGKVKSSENQYQESEKSFFVGQPVMLQHTITSTEHMFFYGIF